MLKKSTKDLMITQPNTELEKHVHYYNSLVLESNYEDVEEAKEVLTTSSIDDIEKDGEIPIAILLSQNLLANQNIYLQVEIWTKRLA